MQSPVLQAVVANQDVHLGVRSHQSVGCRDTAGSHKHGDTCALTNQGGFVAAFFQRHIRPDFDDLLAVPAVAARDHARTPALVAQVVHHRDHRGRLARAAHHHIADHDHRHLDAVGLEDAEHIQGSTQSHQAGVHL
ncbi:hypothetical protein D9M69_645910 [compost metagenome]